MAEETVQAEQVPMKFDIDAWKQQGEGRIVVIDDQITKHQKTMRALEEKIESLNHEKVEILKALGKYEEPKKRNGHSGKVMIRPILLAKLVEHAGEEVSIDDLIDAVQEEKSMASADSIKTSLQRLAKTHDKVVMLEGGKAIYEGEVDA